MINEFKKQVNMLVIADRIEKFENLIEKYEDAIELLETAIKVSELELEKLEADYVIDCNGCIHADGMPQNQDPCCFCIGDLKETQEHDCDTCMYRDFAAYETPCRQCTEDEDNWELAEEE